MAKVKPEPKRITQWSYSRYGTYEICPRQAKLRYVDRIPEEPAGPDAPNVRGERIHKLGEDYINAKRAPKVIPEPYKLFPDVLPELRKMKAKAELEWCYTSEWASTGWTAPDAWCRIKVDVVALTGKTLFIKDWKTGKVRDSHDNQMSLYAVGGLLHMPKAEIVETELVYLDHGKTKQAKFTRAQLPGLIRMWNAKVQPMLTDTIFPPKPGPLCPWCSYCRDKGGPCEF